MKFVKGQHIHLTGIKGVAMTGIAQCLADIGCTLTGSDVAEDFVTKNILDTLNLKIFSGFEVNNIPSPCDALIYTGAHKGPANVEVIEAKARGIAVMNAAEALGEIMRDKQQISVCGVGGKSTTTACTSWIMEDCGAHPSFAVGVGWMPNFPNRMARFSPESTWFIAEADEYAMEPGVNNASRFMSQNPTVIICTNIAFDHPDIFTSFEHTKQTFLTFFEKLVGKNDALLILNADDAELVQLAKAPSLASVPKVFVGTSESADFRITNLEAKQGKTSFCLTRQGRTLDSFIQFPGLFNVMNCCMAMVAVQHTGITLENAMKSVQQFLGTRRRFEFKGEKNGVRYYDDYAHHPKEVSHTIQALREWFPERRLHVIFQPHTYSRTKLLFQEFITSFNNADEVYIMDIFPSAREQFDPSITSSQVAIGIGKNATMSGNLSSTLEAIQSRVKSGDVCITLGAGDVYELHNMIK